MSYINMLPHVLLQVALVIIMALADASGGPRRACRDWFGTIRLVTARHPPAGLAFVQSYVPSVTAGGASSRTRSACRVAKPAVAGRTAPSSTRPEVLSTSMPSRQHVAGLEGSHASLAAEPGRMSCRH